MNLFHVFAYFSYAFIITVGIIGIYNWKNLESKHWKQFAIYLIFLGSMEFFNDFLVRIDHRDWNSLIIIHFVIPLEFIFYYYLFLKESNSNREKNLAYLSILVYIISFFVEAFLAKSSVDFLSNSYLIGNVFMLILILHYFYKLVMSDRILYFTTLRMFWLCVGLLIFWLGTLPYYGAFTFMYKHYPNFFNIYGQLKSILSLTMYVFFIFVFTCGKKK